MFCGKNYLATPFYYTQGHRTIIQETKPMLLAHCSCTTNIPCTRKKQAAGEILNSKCYFLPSRGKRSQLLLLLANTDSIRRIKHK